MLLTRAAGADTTIVFNSPPGGQPGEPVTTQYTSQGVVFSVGPNGQGAAPPDVLSLPSVGYVLNITQVSEISTTGAWAHFPQIPRQRLTLIVGDWGTTSHALQLDVFDASGNLVNSETTTVTGRQAAVPLTVSSGSANISFFHLYVPGPPNVDARGYVVSMTFDSPTGQSPDFSVVFGPLQNGTITLWPGESLPVGMTLERLFGSTGPITLALSGLPPGVSASLNPPSPENGGDGTSISLQLAAPFNAQAFSGTLSLLATPAHSAGSMPHTYNVPIAIPGFYTPRVQGIEVTQGIQCSGFDASTRQCLANFGVPGRRGFGTTADYDGVPFYPRKTTVARVFADAVGAPSSGIAGMTVLLHGFDSSNNELPGSPLLPLSSPPPLADRGSPNVFALEQLDPNGAFDFLLPWEWAGSGTISLEADLFPPPPSFSPSAFAPCTDPTFCAPLAKLTLTGVKFVDIFPDDQFAIDPIKLTLTGGASPPDVPTTLTAVSKLTPQTIVAGDYLASYDITWVNAGCPSPFGNLCPQRNDKSLVVLHALDDWFQNNDHPLYGDNMVLGVSAGGSDLGMESSDIDSDVALGVVNSNRPQTSVAHEIHHGFGRVHASPCTNTVSPGTFEPWPPDNAGWIQGIGLDVASTPPFTINAAGESGEPGNWFDFMSYCAASNDSDSWISVKGWAEILAPVTAASARKRASALAATAPTMRVQASLDGDAVRIISVQTRSFKLPPKGSPSQYGLVLRDDKGTAISSAQLLALRVHLDGAADATLLQGETSKLGAASVEIVRNGRVVASRARSKVPLHVAVLSPRFNDKVGAAGAVGITWTTSGGDGRPFFASVDYSADGGKTWKPVYAGYNIRTALVPARWIGASGAGRMRVRIDDGFSQTSALSDRFNALGGPPVVTIVRPRGKMVVPSDGSLLLEGTAFDDNATRLGGSQLRWFANTPSGSMLLGTGANVTVANPTAGTTSVYLDATDARGRKGSSLVPVAVIAAPTRFLQFDAPHAVRSDATSVALTVRTSLPATLSVNTLGRVAIFQVDRTARTLNVAIPVGKAPALLVLELNGGRGRQVLLIPRVSVP
jgi:hypothetical protein